ncbi:MAG: hypothetical protein JW751_20955 [Polyangiaceae bacterium]|nr:hypothetical protein [Polyangiaceae bacterium]
MENLIKLVVFDLDDTLAASKSALGADMAEALHRLLRTRFVGIISGTKWELFRDLFVARIDPHLHPRLVIAPVSGGQVFRWRNDEWQLVNESSIGLTFPQIQAAFERAFAACGFESPVETWGPQFEDRVSQVTYSALGQQAPASEKRRWDPDLAKRRPIIEILRRILPSYLSIRAGGSNSIDVSGFEKDYGIRQVILQLLHEGITEDQVLFIGDAIYPGGNDFPVTKTNVRYLSTRGLEHTKELIQWLLDDEAGAVAMSGRGPCEQTH